MTKTIHGCGHKIHGEVRQDCVRCDIEGEVEEYLTWYSKHKKIKLNSELLMIVKKLIIGKIDQHEDRISSEYQSRNKGY